MKVFIVGYYEDAEAVFSTKKKAEDFLERDVARRQEILKDHPHTANLVRGGYWIDEYEVDFT